MRRRYHILDVFTDTKLAGNPLAVVLDSDGLDSAAMRKIAREFNLSETVFCAPPRDPVNTASVRIFTPSVELPFAGHPTIGTAILLAELNARDLLAREDVGLVLEEAIGLVCCDVRHRRGEAAHARFAVPGIVERWADPPDRDTVALELGLAASDIGFAGHAPICLSVGVPFTFVPLASIDGLARARLRSGGSADERQAFYLYTPDAMSGNRAFRARMLANGLGVAEDPATGSAAAAFPDVLLAHESFADGDHDCFLLQGVEMGRPSRIGLAFTVAGGKLISAAIGGSAVMVAQGALEL